MAGGIRLGRVLGFEVRLDYSWFVVFLLAAWSLARGVFPEVYRFDPETSWRLGILGALLLFGSVLVHEISHAVVARRFGLEVEGITLFLLGGVAQIKEDPPTPRAELYIAAVGPLVSLWVGLACLAASTGLAGEPLFQAPAALLHYVGIMNLALALFNMIPGFPLDGGRILRSAIWRFTGDIRTATRWASRGGLLLAWLLILYGAGRVLLAGDLSGFWLVLVGWFLNGAAAGAYHQVLLRGALQGVSVADVMSREIPAVDADLRLPQFAEQYLMRYSYTGYPVVREGEFIGVVTVEDIRSLRRDLWGVTSIGVLAHCPDERRVVQDDQEAWDALVQMLESRATRLLVLHGSRVSGSVSRAAILRLLRQRGMSA